MAEKPTDNASAAAALSAAAYLDLWERHAAAIFRDNPWRGPRLDSESGARITKVAADGPANSTSKDRRDG